jgi:3D (Asp-Asp-Asp) domain-containing protein
MSYHAGKLASLAVCVALLAGCGSAAQRHQLLGAGHQRSSPAPVVVSLQLELPNIGFSAAPTVSYATGAGHPTLRGVVQPAGATVYMLNPDGTRSAVNPATGGRFAVHAKLTPGLNSFHFTAAELGAKSAGADLDVTWRGPAADATQAAIQANPTKYLPPASAGLNRKLPPLPGLQQIAGGSLALTFSLNPIKAAPPPTTGGPGKWLNGFELTEYYPALEAWFVGALVSAPGLGSAHRIDWLYSAHGLSMEGDGVGLDGRQYHISNVGAGGWVDPSGNSGGSWYWRTGGFWRNGSGSLTFPLGNGGWSNGSGGAYVAPPSGISFAQGTSQNLAYLRSVAVDPSVIPMHSHIYIPAYQSINGGWFEADDTGGAIIGRHIDVFRPPPANPNSGDGLGFVTGQTVYIVPPGVPLP